MVSNDGEASTLLLMLLSSKLRFLFLFNLLLLFVVCWVLNSLSSIKDSLTQSIWQIDIDDPILMNLSAESFIQSIQVIIHIPYILSSRPSSLHDRPLLLNFHPSVHSSVRTNSSPHLFIRQFTHPSIHPFIHPHSNVRIVSSATWDNFSRAKLVCSLSRFISNSWDFIGSNKLRLVKPMTSTTFPVHLNNWKLNKMH